MHTNISFRVRTRCSRIYPRTIGYLYWTKIRLGAVLVCKAAENNVRKHRWIYNICYLNSSEFHRRWFLKQ